MGRPSLGDRARKSLRLRKSLCKRAEEHASRSGMTFNSWIEQLVERSLPPTIDGECHQEELPLGA